jgi:hypothetical protein
VTSRIAAKVVELVSRQWRRRGRSSSQPLRNCDYRRRHSRRALRRLSSNDERRQDGVFAEHTGCAAQQQLGWRCATCRLDAERLRSTLRSRPNKPLAIRQGLAESGQRHGAGASSNPSRSAPAARPGLSRACARPFEIPMRTCLRAGYGAAACRRIPSGGSSTTERSCWSATWRGSVLRC